MKRINRPYRVSEPVVRGVALEVLALSLAAMIFHSVPILILLALDFAVRALLTPSFSPLAILSRKIITPLIHFRRKQVVFKPKRFAASIGFVLSVTALLFMNRIATGTYITLVLLSFFSFLEAFFRFCAGCKIFALLVKTGLAKEDICPDCVYLDGEGI